MGKRKDIHYWNVPVTKTLDRAVENAIKIDMHNTKADLIREAVREKLDRMGLRVKLEPLKE
jgi:Arc/MetJ-type ribon-helix-helix transcriptional regulator